MGQVHLPHSLNTPQRKLLTRHTAVGTWNDWKRGRDRNAKHKAERVQGRAGLQENIMLS